MVLEDTLHSGWVCSSATCLGVDKLGSMGPKLLIWRCKSGRYALHQVPWSECAPNRILRLSKTAGWDYYLGTTVMDSVFQVMCAGCRKCLLPSLSQSDSQWLGLQQPLQSPWFWDQSKGSHKVNHNAGDERPVVPQTRFSFLTGGVRVSGETSLQGAVLAWKRGNAVNMHPLLTLIIQSVSCL